MARILFADDELDIQEVVKYILEREGYEVILASDGNIALELAKNSLPDLIILDYRMPGLDGTDVCRLIKQHKDLAAIPIIMMTAYAQEKENGLSAGAVDFVVKPIEKADLLLRVRSILKVRDVKNELQRMIAYIKELENKLE